MKLKIKIVYLSILIFVMVSISGCQLAKSDTKQTEDIDRLMGTYIVINDLGFTEEEFNYPRGTEKYMLN